jgi:hypothetical protein
VDDVDVVKDSLRRLCMVVLVALLCSAGGGDDDEGDVEAWVLCWVGKMVDRGDQRMHHIVNQVSIHERIFRTVPKSIQCELAMPVVTVGVPNSRLNTVEYCCVTARGFRKRHSIAIALLPYHPVSKSLSERGEGLVTIIHI